MLFDPKSVLLIASLASGLWAANAAGGSAQSIAAGGQPERLQSQLVVSNALDGQTYRVGIVRSGSGAPPDSQELEDTVTFGNGLFSSAICTRYHFTAAPYQSRADGEVVWFSATLESPTDGTMVWTATIIDGQLTGTMHWTKSRWYWTIEIEHRIHGVQVRNP